MLPDIKSDNAYQDLSAKLHPNRIVGCSDKMYWIISTILGQDWVTRDGSYESFTITCDGFVVDNDLFLGGVVDFERNVFGYVEAAELTGEQRQHFDKLYARKVHDWR